MIIIVIDEAHSATSTMLEKVDDKDEVYKPTLNVRADVVEQATESLFILGARDCFHGFANNLVCAPKQLLQCGYSFGIIGLSE